VLASGNVVFRSGLTSSAEIENLAEHAMAIGMGRTFGTLVRPVQSLQTLLDGDPFAAFSVPQEAKRVVTFLRDAKVAGPDLPIERDGVQILKRQQRRADGVCAAPKDRFSWSCWKKAYGKDIDYRQECGSRECAGAVSAPGPIARWPFGSNRPNEPLSD
jgi:uncharacterized protein (DUF1697 family)